MTATIFIQQSTELKWKQKYQILAEQIENLRAYLQLENGINVTDGKKMGKILDKKISSTGVPEILVIWSENLTKLEEPKKLKLEPMIDLAIQAGDTIIINSQHQTQAGERFEIKELQGDGWILTTTNQQFHCEHFYAFTMNKEEDK